MIWLRATRSFGLYYRNRRLYPHLYLTWVLYCTMANDADGLGSSPSPELGSGPIAYFCSFFETWTGDPLPTFYCPVITLRFDNLISMWRDTV